MLPSPKSNYNLQLQDYSGLPNLQVQMPSEWLHLLQGRHLEFKKHLLSRDSTKTHRTGSLLRRRTSFFLPSSVPSFHSLPSPFLSLPADFLSFHLLREKNNGKLEKANLGEQKWLAFCSSFHMDVDLGLSLVYYSHPWILPLVSWGVSQCSRW